jgi:hypothetical protein
MRPRTKALFETQASLCLVSEHAYTFSDIKTKQNSKRNLALKISVALKRLASVVMSPESK